MKTKIKLFLMKSCRSENLKTRFLRKYDMTKVSELVLKRSIPGSFCETRKIGGMVTPDAWLSNFDLTFRKFRVTKYNFLNKNAPELSVSGTALTILKI